MASDIISGIVERELQSLEQDSTYRAILDKLRAKQQPILDNISSKVKSTIKDFVSGVNDVSIEPYKGLSRAIRGDFRVLIDDGARTELSLKGDGVISLATIALIRYVSQESLASKSLILSIEEPESHLHSRSVHGIRRVLKDISQQHQVIITTHSPILVEREVLKQNILVQSGHAKRAKKIDDIREALGIQLSDNLVGAYLVLLVEGEEDKDILTCWIQALSPPISNAIEHRILLVDHLAGASNVGYKATFYKQNVCNIHVYMDNDDDGRNAVTDAMAKGLIETSDYNLASCRDMRSSEIEDLINLESYRDAVVSNHGVDLQNPLFRCADSKWSDRVKAVFEAAGKIWNKQIKMHLKRTVADAAVAAGVTSLNSHRQTSVDNLVQGIEAKLSKRNA